MPKSLHIHTLSVMLSVSVSASALYVFSPPGHMVKHRNLILGVNMYTFMYAHQKFSDSDGVFCRSDFGNLW